MTVKEVHNAFENMVSDDEIQLGISRNADPVNLQKWLRFAFIKGIEAAEAKKRWPDSAVEADKQNMKELGVLWP